MYAQLFELHANLLKALSHPRRLEIIHLLRDQELPVTDIYTMLDLPQANISQHLMVLRDAQVVHARREVHLESKDQGQKR
jgi:ArsR family transcriptional regulator